MRISDWSSDVCSSDLCYPDIESLPKAPDLAVLAIGAKDVTPMLERCHAKGVKAAIVYAAGFAEEGPIGRALQDQRSEERRVGKDCVRPGRIRWSRFH